MVAREWYELEGSRVGHGGGEQKERKKERTPGNDARTDVEKKGWRNIRIDIRPGKRSSAARERRVAEGEDGREK